MRAAPIGRPAGNARPGSARPGGTRPGGTSRWALALLVLALGALVGVAPPRPLAAQALGIPSQEAPPERRNESRPPAPSEDRVWQSGYWRRLGGSWIWAAGRWVAPPSDELRWVNGDWLRKPWGYVWQPGRWTLKEGFVVPGEEAAIDPIPPG